MTPATVITGPALIAFAVTLDAVQHPNLILVNDAPASRHIL